MKPEYPGSDEENDNSFIAALPRYPKRKSYCYLKRDLESTSLILMRLKSIDDQAIQRVVEVDTDSTFSEITLATEEVSLLNKFVAGRLEKISKLAEVNFLRF